VRLDGAMVNNLCCIPQLSVGWHHKNLLYLHRKLLLKSGGGVKSLAFSAFIHVPAVANFSSHL
jgi:hypothetical protein